MRINHRRRSDRRPSLREQVGLVWHEFTGRQSQFSIASSALAAVLAITMLFDLMVGHEHVQRAVVLGWLSSYVAWVVLPLVFGRSYPRWAGLCLIGYVAFWSLISLIDAVHAHALLNALFEAPMIGMYLGWFYRGAVARLTLVAYLAVLCASVLNEVGRHDYEFSPLVVLAYTILIAVFCLETGSHLYRSSRLQAMTDPLTGSLNRRGLSAGTLKAIERAAKDGVGFTFFVLDFDNFKAINDAGGHAAGDEALRSCSREWMKMLGAGDLVARTGGDEFALLVHGDPASTQRRIAELREASEFDWSWGHVEYRNGDSLDSLMFQADQELYRRRLGRNTRSRAASDRMEFP